MNSPTVFRLIDTGAGSAAWNMAVDEALLLLAADGGVPPVLRFFSWDKPSLSIGSFQKTDELNLDEIKARAIPLVRRPTGGRAVLHDAELTYSVTSPIPSELFPSDLLGSYKTIGSCFLAGLTRLGVDVSLVPVMKNPDRKRKQCQAKDPLCFSSPSWYEVLSGGKKLIGSAQRRLRTAFLQQGSLLVRLDIPALTGLLRYQDEAARETAENALTSKMTALGELGGATGMDSLKNALAAGFEEVLGVRMVRSELMAEESALAVRLLEEKYSRDAWNLTRAS